MICKCGGVLNVIRVETPPKHLSKQEKLVYSRLCDVECLNCEKIYYSQPFDDGNRLNIAKDLRRGGD